jgi:proteasome lid subunit RPN8/RPN11
MELTAEHRAALMRAYRAAYPHECCGLLLGSQDGSGGRVHRVLRTLNAVSRPGGFAIPDAEIDRGRFLAAQAGLSILALYHSHPSGATELSVADLAALEHTEWPWLVLTEDPSTRELVLTWWTASAVARERRATEGLGLTGDRQL